MEEEEEPLEERPGALVPLVKRALPWIALAVVLVVSLSIWSGFQSAQRAASAAAAASAEASAAASMVASASVTTTETGLIAKVTSDVPLRSQPGTVTEILATARQGSTLTVLARQNTWLQVKDGAGHIGWIPNDTQYVTVQAK
jgi:uncharacterized protein YgiM (DUF1202 family)